MLKATNLPTIFEAQSFVEAGGLMSYGENDRLRFRRVASYVGRILKGVRPQDLPVEHSTSIELTLNLKTARALGLAIPPSIPARARVIE